MKQRIPRDPRYQANLRKFGRRTAGLIRLCEKPRPAPADPVPPGLMRPEDAESTLKLFDDPR